MVALGISDGVGGEHPGIGWLHESLVRSIALLRDEGMLL
jgi:hypothetical protein